MPSGPTLKVTRSDSGKRLDKFLMEKKVFVSRSQIKKLIDRKMVKINGVPAKAGTAIREGHAISIDLPLEESKTIKSEDIPLDIIYEDSRIILINKPPGMVVHPAPGHSSGTLVNAVLAKVGDFKPIMGEIRPGIVHRLDKDTSGVMVVAKDEMSLMELSRQFKNRTVQKTYMAVVIGEFGNESVIVEKTIGRSVKNRKPRTAVKNRHMKTGM
jgi:23S rRNA pseudouridine1911/1915/1917 synthase